MRFSCLLVLSLLLGACSHEAENTGMRNSSNVITLPATYAMMEAPSVSEGSPVAPGHVSRYQRQMIVTGGPDKPSTPCAQNFDQIMDHLETLMKPQIDENNRIAAEQAAAYPL